ncbi:ScbA/BarX family gamma-butyrolactone biosynthesis protein [Amycolatopsis japonica]|uniref:ScbA/BarX family gamma-butyrolactone biosynthesis protein n=1 Tax=Amycolatopsis japonica TaxID=208439 RepID=UPI00382776D3
MAKSEAEAVTRSIPVERLLVHKNAANEVFVTGADVLAPHRYRVTGRWHRAQLVGPRGKDAPVDPLLFAETVRQATIYLSHRYLDVPLDHPFVLSGLHFRLDRPGLTVPEDGELPIDLEVTLNEPERRPGRFTCALEVVLWAGGVRAGSAGLRWNTLEPRRYAALRHRSVVTGEPSPRLPPVEAALAGMLDERDVLLADGPDGDPAWRLRLNRDHEVLFDHESDHIPGMTLLEAFRQATTAQYPQWTLGAADVTFTRFGELDLPVRIEVTGDGRTFDVKAFQAGNVLAAAKLEGLTATGSLSPARVAPVAAAACAAAAVLDQERRLPEGVVRAVTEAGFARHFVPKRWGGTAGSFTDLVDAAVALGQTCTSTAWCSTLYAAHGRLAAYFPEVGQRELWSATPDVRIAAAVMPPRGTAIPVDNGMVLSGSWSLASGVDAADWILLASDTGPETDRRQTIFAVPATDCVVERTWDTLGMRGTGSNTVVAKDVFVPWHRRVDLAELLRPRPDAARCHQVPYPMVAGLLFAAPLLGAAMGAEREWVARMATRTSVRGIPARENHVVADVLAASSAEIEAGRLLLEQAAHRADYAAVTGLAIAENQRDCSRATQLCVTAVDRLVRAGGASGRAADDPVQLRWLDMTVGASHAALAPEAAAAAYVRARLGLEAVA